MRRLILCLALLASVALSVCPAAEALVAKIHEGDKVEVVFEEKDGQKVVSSVEVTGQ